MQRDDSINEEARLAALERYNILNTAPEESFDRITRLARMALQIPIVLVSLVDRDRQWFKSKQGLEVAETPRSIAFCTRAIEQDVPLIVPDAREHPLFRDNPLVVGEPHIRFYIGVPLKMHDGHNIGTLCAIDMRRVNCRLSKSMLFRILQVWLSEKSNYDRLRQPTVLLAL